MPSAAKDACEALAAEALVRDVRALAAKWRCNCGGPSPEGRHEMHCDSSYGDELRAALARHASAAAGAHPPLPQSYVGQQDGSNEAGARSADA